MAGVKELKAQIVIGAKGDASLNATNNKLLAMGKKWEQYGAKMTRSGAMMTAAVTTPFAMVAKEAGGLYMEFDDSMRYVKAIGELTQGQYEAVEMAARKAGATTRYTATQSADAMLSIAQAGYDYKENIALLPDVMDLATAGGLELQASAKGLMASQKALNIPLSDTRRLLDEMTAASSASMLGLDGVISGVETIGATGRMMAGGSAEVLTYIGLLGDAGMEGAEAGTKLRNIILSLMAPTSKAADLMSELKMSEDEWAEAVGEIDADAAKRTMADIGLSAFDATGKLRPLNDTLTDLQAILSTKTVQKQAEILATLFNKRDLAGVNKLLGDTTGAYGKMSDAVQNSEGLASRIATTREEGLGGSMRELSSAVEELALAFTEPVAELVQGLAGSVQNLVTWVSELSDGDKERILALIGGFAALGPAKLAIGGATQLVGGFISLLATPAGQLILVTGALTAAGTLIKLWNDHLVDEDLAGRFGTLKVDAEALGTAIQGMNTDIQNNINALTSYDDQLSKTTEAFTTAQSEMSGTLMSAMLVGETLSEADKTKLISYVDAVERELLTAISTRQEGSKAFYGLILGSGATEQDQELAGKLSERVNGYYEGLTLEAQNVGNQLRQAVVEAMADGEITQAEQQNIREYQRRMAQIMAEVEAYNREVADEEMNIRMGSLSEGGLDTIYDTVMAYQKNSLESIDRQFIGEMARAKVAGAAQDEMDFIQGRWDAAKAGVLQNTTLYLARGLTSGMGDAYKTELDKTKVDIMALLDAFWQDVTDGPEYAAMDTTWFENYIAGGIQNIDNIWGPARQGLLEKRKKYFTPELRKQFADEAQAYIDAGEKVPEELQNAIHEMTVLDILAGDVNAAAPNLYQLMKAMGHEAGNKYIIGFDEALGSWKLLPGPGINGKADQSWKPSDASGGMYGLYAEGGRATRPSIFGEGDTAEWAIPEQRTPQTLSLLRDATAASGFTPWDLAGVGNLGGSASRPFTLQYAPVIHLQGGSTSGLGKALEQDKASLERMIRRILEDQDRGRLSYNDDGGRQ